MTKCWNCKSNNYVEEPLHEHCPDCNIEFDMAGYNARGPNGTYILAALRLNAKRAEAEYKAMKSKTLAGIFGRTFKKIFGG